MEIKVKTNPLQLHASDFSQIFHVMESTFPEHKFDT